MRIALCDDDTSELVKIREVLREFIHSKQSEYEIVLETFLGGHDLLKSISHYASFDLRQHLFTYTSEEGCAGVCIITRNDAGRIQEKNCLVSLTVYSCKLH